MCGIAGVVHFADRYPPPSLDLLRAMAATIHHRGPDEFGAYRDNHAGLVSARLSIIDLATGQQPLANEDEDLWVVYNGEIFNYIELRQELERLGHRFRTHSDTEVIVHAYESWGDRCFARFNGQWAIALWNSRARRLVLSRDRVGVRPLYVHERNGGVWFGSEVKAIFADPTVPRVINPRGLDQVFTYWSPVAPVTVFEGIEEIRPGTVVTYAPHLSRKETAFWEPSYPRGGVPAEKLTITEATEALREKLLKATELRMLRSDVPVGSYLSGGLDSSVVAWMARQVKVGAFHTFSLRFEDQEFDETKYQRMMAETIDSQHEELVVTRSDVARVFPEVIRFAERPILRTAPAPLFLLSAEVQKAGIKAVLTGEGADEMLAGYDIFREAKIREFWSHQPESKVRPKLFDRIYPYLARSPKQAKGMALEFWGRGLDRAGTPGFTHDPRWRTTSSLKKFFSPRLRSDLEQTPAPDFLDSLPPGFGEWDLLAQGQYIEVATLLSGYLLSSQGDRMLMAHSVEGRFPYLDSEFIEFSNHLPSAYKLSGLNEKFLLKRMAQGIVPEAIIRRQKQAYRAPDAICFVAPDSPEYVAEALSMEALQEAGIFDPNAVRSLYAKCQSRARGSHGDVSFSNTDNMGLVGVLSTQLLYDQFVRRRADVPTRTLEFNTTIDRTGVGQRELAKGTV